MAQALAQWQHLVPSCKATVALHWAILIVLYRPGGMVIKIAVKLGIFVDIIDKSEVRKKNLPHFHDFT
jgi:hypothetical protein